MQQAYELGARRVRQPHWPAGLTLPLVKVLGKDGHVHVEAATTGSWKSLSFAITAKVDKDKWVPCTSEGQMMAVA